MQPVHSATHVAPPSGTAVRVRKACYTCVRVRSPTLPRHACTSSNLLHSYVALLFIKSVVGLAKLTFEVPTFFIESIVGLAN